jgi:RNA polymerase sigma-70 factor (ECF subfamily)
MSAAVTGAAAPTGRQITELVDQVDNGNDRDRDRAVAAYDALDRAGRRVLLDGLAVRAAAGSSSALDVLLRLVDRHGLARSPLWSILIKPEPVEDAHQDVLIALARSVHRYRGDAAFTTWLHSVAHNIAVDHLRRIKRTLPLAADTDNEAAETEAQRLSSLVASRADLRHAVAALPDTYRDAITMADLDRATYDEIAIALDIPIGTVKSRLARGRAILARHIDNSDRPA